MLERIARVGLWLLCLVPFVVLVYALVQAQLGPDPAERIMHVTGEWALRFLLCTLLISPLRLWTGWAFLMKLRRMLGLYSFFYACVHLLCFAHFFLGWTWVILVEELLERPYITAGFSAWLLMLPLALTSTRAMQRRLRKNWGRLHRAIYIAALCASVHLIWQSRSDIGEALLYSVIIFALLAWRVWRYFKRQRAVASPAQA